MGTELVELPSHVVAVARPLLAGFWLTDPQQHSSPVRVTGPHTMASSAGKPGGGTGGGHDLSDSSFTDNDHVAHDRQRRKKKKCSKSEGKELTAETKADSAREALADAQHKLQVAEAKAEEAKKVSQCAAKQCTAQVAANVA